MCVWVCCSIQQGSNVSGKQTAYCLSDGQHKNVTRRFFFWSAICRIPRPVSCSRQAAEAVHELDVEGVENRGIGRSKRQKLTADQRGYARIRKTISAKLYPLSS